MLDYRLDGKVAVITMDDGKVNALGFDMIGALSESFSRAKSEAAAVLLAGRPGCFSAGFDLKVVKSGDENVRKIFDAGLNMMFGIFDFPLPVVMASTGHAIAGGAVLLLCGDLRFGQTGENSTGLNEVAIGVTLPSSIVELARARLSRRHFTRAVMGAELYGPEGAADAGFLDGVLPPELLLEEGLSRASSLAALPRRAFGETKARCREGLAFELRRLLKAELPSITGPRL